MIVGRSFWVVLVAAAPLNWQFARLDENWRWLKGKSDRYNQFIWEDTSLPALWGAIARNVLYLYSYSSYVPAPASYNRLSTRLVLARVAGSLHLHSSGIHYPNLVAISIHSWVRSIVTTMAIKPASPEPAPHDLCDRFAGLWRIGKSPHPL